MEGVLLVDGASLTTVVAQTNFSDKQFPRLKTSIFSEHLLVLIWALTNQNLT